MAAHPICPAPPAGRAALRHIVRALAHAVIKQALHAIIQALQILTAAQTPFLLQRLLRRSVGLLRHPIPGAAVPRQIFGHLAEVLPDVRLKHTGAPVIPALAIVKIFTNIHFILQCLNYLL